MFQNTHPIRNTDGLMQRVIGYGKIIISRHYCSHAVVPMSVRPVTIGPAVKPSQGGRLLKSDPSTVHLNRATQLERIKAWFLAWTPLPLFTGYCESFERFATSSSGVAPVYPLVTERRDNIFRSVLPGNKEKSFRSLLWFLFSTRTQNFHSTLLAHSNASGPGAVCQKVYHHHHQ